MVTRRAAVYVESAELTGFERTDQASERDGNQHHLIPSGVRRERSMGVGTEQKDHTFVHLSKITEDATCAAQRVADVI